MKKLVLSCLVVLSCCFLSACDKSTKSVDDQFIMPDGLKDCKAYKMRGTGVTLYVVRCPLSTTSTSTSDKNPTQAVVTEK